MDPTRESTYKILDKFIGEMAILFPDRYFHIGGDEVNGKQWDANPKIHEFMQAHNLKSDQELQQYFTDRVEKIVSKHHKFMVGWDEILTPGMPKDIVIQSWRGQDSLAEAARQGYRGILSSGYYLDAMAPASQHYLVDPLAGADATLTAAQQKLILGGEACMWEEFASDETHRVAHLAARRGDRRAPMVSAASAGCEFDVSQDGGGQRAFGRTGPEASLEQRRDAGARSRNR